MAQTDDFRGLGLRTLPPETWGRRLARARATAGLTLRDVEELLPGHLSRATLDRLEKWETAPKRRQDRSRAVAALVLYGFNPRDFELERADVPEWMDLRVISKLRLRRSG
jgi:hypothetical protein